MHTQFKDVEFKQCKLVGVQFNNSNDFLRTFNFTDCILDFASFTNTKIDHTHFNSSKLISTDFTNTEAKKVVFKDSDLQNTIFDNTNLEQADFSSAYNFNITPSKNNIKKAIFHKENLSGLLHSSGIIIKS
ncbi:hypothetical protein GCM10011444_27510 [Winogradskyella haliclonae]|uniref:Pentapeptide repeat-containing protein n=2 Tax=Winogradskyella haliclonae TaxID=2048558 RepID=A0ABQ2C125_9FLAO|nr:hypothetical protein GCM10011444_27510 [Winogradskyella haliclonae]